MIIKNDIKSIVVEDGVKNESIGMSLDSDSAPILMQMLSKQLYSDEIGSPIRECVSNALDSSRRANSDKPIIVGLCVGKTNNIEFSVEDFGTGLDDSDINNVISKYGKSTKRATNTELGMWGLGFKSPLAYKPSFTFVCRKDGMERTYMMYEGEIENTIDLLNEVSTDKPNGVKVIISVNYSDRLTFVSKIKEQLAYFEKVYFNVNVPSSYYGDRIIPNDFNIHRDENYQWSELVESNYLHISLDDVYYPIDFQKLGINAINIPIALRFGLDDGLAPTISREAIQYTPAAKKIIIDKIKTVAAELVTKYNDTLEETDDLNLIFEFYNKKEKREFALDGKLINVYSISEYSDVAIGSPTIKDINHLDPKIVADKKKYLTSRYKIQYEIGSRLVFKTKNGKENVPIGTFDDVYIYEGKIGGVMREYLKSIRQMNKSSIFVKKMGDRALGFPVSLWNDDDAYYHLLNLKNHPKSEWRNLIKDWVTIENRILSNYNKLKDVAIDPTWLADRKKKRITSIGTGTRVRKIQGEINAKSAIPLERNVTGQNCKFVGQIFGIDKLSKYPGITIYGHHDQKYQLDKLYGMINHYTRSMNISIISLSSREKKNVDDLDIHNLVKYEEFMKGETKQFRRIITTYKIMNLISDYSSVFNHSDELKPISKSLYKSLKNLEEYKEKHYSNSYSYRSDKIFDVLITLAEDNDLYDYSIYDEYLEVKSLLEKYKFINEVLRVTETQYSYTAGARLKSETAISLLVDLFRFYKHRIDYHNYKNIMNDIEEKEEDEEESLTDETIEELLNEED